jgi:twitching motility protein PilT
MATNVIQLGTGLPVRKDPQYLIQLLAEARTKRASDLHVTAGDVPWLRIDGQMRASQDEAIVAPECIQAFMEGLNFNDKQREKFYSEVGHTESRYEDPQCGPIRLQAYRTQTGDSIALRLLSERVPKLETLGLPEIVRTFPDIRNGLVLFTGETGSGKSTALAALIDRILDADGRNVLTFEDPIEYIHKRVKSDGQARGSRVNQMQIGTHAQSYTNCLHSALRADPDVLMVGEMRDSATILKTIEAAETGHTVFSTGHDQRATKTISRLVNAFEPDAQAAICYSLAQVLRAVVSLRLLPHSSGTGRVSCAEVLVINDSVKSLIEERKLSMIGNALSQGSRDGMQTLEDSLARLVAEGKITKEVARGEVEIERHEQLKQMFERHKIKW